MGTISIGLFFHARSRREGIDQDAVNGHELPMEMSHWLANDMHITNE
jgi:hypothetical protein